MFFCQSATLASCPPGFQRINNGCYAFYTATTWTLAQQFCSALTVPAGTVSHLISLESEAEVIGLQFWLKGKINI
jgi:hypothetical protein